MRMLIMVAFLAASLPASSQTVYRCVEQGKATSYQTEPCSQTAKTAAAVKFVPDRTPPRVVPAPTVAPARYQRPQTAQLHRVPQASDQQKCRSAKHARDLALGPSNQQGTVEVRRFHNDAVARACY